MTSPRRLYLDNAATSFPKPPSVIDAMTQYATEIGSSPGRGGYAESLAGAAVIDTCRERLNTLFNAAGPERFIFTLNTSDALNLAIKGLVSHARRSAPTSPIHAVTTSMAHNSVLRPLNALSDDGLTPSVTWSRVPVDPATGSASPADIEAAITDSTLFVAIDHASNVSGTLQPIDQIATICRPRGVALIVDAAQTAGRVPIDFESLDIDLVAFPGHKALLGPLGTGCLYIAPGIEDRLATIREGGTGSASELDSQPTTLPDKYEAGSHNTIGIAGLSAGLEWLLDRGIDQLWMIEQSHITKITEALADTNAFPGLKLLGPSRCENRVGVFSFTHEAVSPHELAAILESEFGVLSRAGIHCAPHAHRTFETTDRGGAVRLSLGPFTSACDVEQMLAALREVCAAFSATR